MRDIVAGFGGIALLVLGTLAGVILLRWRRTERWGRRWLTALAIAYWVMSTLAAPTFFVTLLARTYTPLAAGPDLAGVSTIVVLSGGSATVVGQDREFGVLTPDSLSRVLETSRIFHMLPDARIVAAGAPIPSSPPSDTIPDALIMRSTLASMGVPADRVVLEVQGHNTHEQARNVAPILRQYGAQRFVLVTSSFHMRRAEACFRAEGLTPIPAISTYGPDESSLGDYLVPNPAALQLSQWVLHEYVGLAYYRMRGWI
jgi:uncharacterized SAM-binding protein YcdF (DUF218 family)